MLKGRLVENLRVHIFNPNCPTILTTDASEIGLGAELAQIQNGREVPIAFSAKMLSERQRNYLASERGFLGAVVAVEKFEKLLLGRKFTLRTDHEALKTLLKQRGKGCASGKFMHWAERLAFFDFQPEYKKGSENFVADYLSRVPSEPPDEEDPIDHIVVRNISASGIKLEEIQAETAKDAYLQKVDQYLQKGWPQGKALDAALRPYYNIRNELSREKSYLARSDDRVLVPWSLQRQILELAHQGYLGIVRMKGKLCEAYWWPGMDKDVEHIVRHCEGCQWSHKSVSPHKVPHTAISAPTAP